MEEKTKQIQNYLTTKANPVIQPMLEQMAKQRPDNVLTWIQLYINKKVTELNDNRNHQSDDDEINEEQFKKKLERAKKNGGKKISRQGISAQVFGKFNQKSDFKPKVVQKKSELEQQIRTLLEKSILFQSLTEADMMCVVKATEVIQTAEGQKIITEGEQGDALFIVSSGEYDCHKVINQVATYLKTYKTGEAFGQLSLMYNAPRAATITCTTAGEVFKLDRQTFRNIVQEAAIKKRGYYSKILSKVDILSDMDAYERDQVCDALKEESFGPNDYVMRQGQDGDKFYIIAQGQLVAEKKEGNSPAKKVFEYKEGQYFGEIALIKNTVRQASVKALTPCRLVCIDRNTFKRLLGPLEGILSRNMEKYKKIIDH